MTTNRVLYLFGTAAPPVLNIAGVIERAQSADWELAELTGHPVRSQ